MHQISRTAIYLSYCFVTQKFHLDVTIFLSLYGIELWGLNFLI